MPQARNITAHQTAALLVARGELTYAQIAAQVGVDVDTLRSWRRDLEFKQIVESHQAAFLEEIRSLTIGQLWFRVRERQRRHDALMRVIEERAKSDLMQKVPGGTTGLLVHNVKMLGSGRNAVRVDLFRVDTGLLAELRALEMEVAKEFGQWTDKSEQKNDTTLTLSEDDMPDWFKAMAPIAENEPAETHAETDDAGQSA